MPKLYVEPGDNSPEKGSKTVGVSSKKKKVDFNRYVRVKYITKITLVQTRKVKLSIHPKNPTSSKYVRRSVLAILQPEKETCNHNVTKITTSSKTR